MRLVAFVCKITSFLRRGNLTLVPQKLYLYQQKFRSPKCTDVNEEIDSSMRREKVARMGIDLSLKINAKQNEIEEEEERQRNILLDDQKNNKEEEAVEQITEGEIEEDDASVEENLLASTTVRDFKVFFNQCYVSLILQSTINCLALYSQNRWYNHVD